MRRKKNNFKFTKKTHSRRGIRSCFLSVVSMAVMGYVVFDSFCHEGNGNVYLGSAGFLMMVLWGIKSLGEEDSFKGIPVAAVILSFVATFAWGTIYAAGFFV